MPNEEGIDASYMLNTLRKLIEIPSPTGMAGEAIEYIERLLLELNIESSRTKKGGLICKIKARSEIPLCALASHADTLGAMVKEIKLNGRLKLTKIGDFAWNTIEGEGCTIHTHSGKSIRGSILLTKASAHVHGSEVNVLKREEGNMEVRLDIRTENDEQTRSAGIKVGSLIATTRLIAAYILESH